MVFKISVIQKKCIFFIIEFLEINNFSKDHTLIYKDTVNFKFAIKAINKKGKVGILEDLDEKWMYVYVTFRGKIFGQKYTRKQIYSIFELSF